MFSRIMNVTRAVGFSIALLVLSGGVPLWSQASDCPDTAIGGQTGTNYNLVSQSLVTETRTVTVNAGICGIGGSATTTTVTQYNVGYYSNSTGDIAIVDCRTGRIIGWE
jgi:FlaG/FlaF family flagellin (archaellin)